MRSPSICVLSVLALAALVPACAHKPQLAATPAPEPVAVVPTPVPAAPAAPAVPSLPDVAELNRRGYLKDAFFDFDKSSIRADARTALDGDSSWLRNHPTVQLRIEGHCDERGTRAYNMALGERRAWAAREYLAELGVNASRVAIVSYGKERPFCDGHDETCWQENRRDHLLVTAR